MQRLLILLFFILPTVAQADGTDSAFDSRHKEALHQNPLAVHLSLRTVGGSTFHLFETIPIEIAYSTTRLDTFTIEMDEAMNPAGGSRRFEIDAPDGVDGVLLTEQEWGSRTFICCESDKRSLSQKPVIFKRELTDYLRFQKPGTYRIFLSTRRVFKIGGAEEQFMASKFALTSNILTLTILPDDPDWDARRLAGLLTELDSPRLKANYDSLKKKIDLDNSETHKFQAMANELAHTPYAVAQKMLNALDTPEAIHERVNRMDLVSSKYLGSHVDYEGKTIFYQPLLASTVRPDLIVAAMESRARRPDFGVDYDYAYHWAEFLVQRDDTGVFRPFADEQEQRKRIHSFLLGNVEAKKQIISELSAHLDEKIATAKRITALTIKNLNDDIAYASGQKPKPD
jgi:hypothetical protein